MSRAFSTLVANFSGLRRTFHRNGREYLVAPMTLIVPGVLPGSAGPLYYSPEDIAESQERWQNIPITVDHPKLNGRHVSAATRGVQHIGTLDRPAIVNGKLTALGTFDLQKTRKADPRIYNALLSGERMEVSTGLFSDNIPVRQAMQYNGRQFTHVARNFTPDHLAILPDAVGACSLNDGCGLNVNKKSGCDCKSHNKCSCHKKAKRKKMELTANQRASLVANLVKSAPWDADDEALLETFDDEKLLTLRRHQLAANKTVADDSPKMRKVGASIPDEGDDPQGTAPIVDKAKMPKKATMNSADASSLDEILSAKHPSEMTAEEFFDAAPPEIKEVLGEAVKVRNERKAAIVERLVANVRNDDTRKALVKNFMAKPIKELEALTLMLPTPSKTGNPFTGTSNYLGAAGANPVLNQEVTDEDRADYLPIPVLNFGKEEDAA